MKYKKKVLFIPICLILVGIAAGIYFYCQSHKTVFSSTEYCFSPDSKYFLTDDGLFYGDGSYIKYYDQKSKKSVYLCNKPDCKHNSEDCDAYYNYPLTIFVYHNKFYCMTMDTSIVKNGYNKEILYESNLDGSNRKMLCNFEGGGVSNFYAYQGKLYYTYMQEDEPENKNSCCSLVTISLRAYDLSKNKTIILYQEKSPDKWNRIFRICESNDHNKIYLLSQYYNAKIDDIVNNSTNSSNETDNLELLYQTEQLYRSEFMCYNIKTKKTTPSFSSFNTKNHVMTAFVKDDYVYCNSLTSTNNKEYSYFLRYNDKTGQQENMIEETRNLACSFMNRKAVINVESVGNFYFDMDTDEFYVLKKDSLYIQAISLSGNYIGIDVGDYSGMEVGQVYTTNLFKPAILTKEKFLSYYEKYQEGSIKDFHFNSVKDE